jgi:alkyl hydroperoxide reductase subunit F
MFDLVIIGGGPAGVTAAIYAARKRIDFIMVTQDIGGQTAWSADVENYTGYQFITGAELVKKFEEHLKQFSVKLRENEDVVRIKKTTLGFLTETKKSTFESYSVLIASGRRPRLLNVPGEEAFKNRGVTYCATCDGPVFANKIVAVIGGGNSALDATLQLVNIAEKIYLVNVAPELTADAVMCQKAQSSQKVEILNKAVVKEIYGKQFVEGIKLDVDGVFRDMSLKGVFIEIGSTPNSDIIDFVVKDANGEIVVDQSNRTSALGIFAAGDVTNIPEKQIVVAAGEGAKAVLGIFRYLTTRS